jgi:hypothetical protein
VSGPLGVVPARSFRASTRHASHRDETLPPASGRHRWFALESTWRPSAELRWRRVAGAASGPARHEPPRGGSLSAGPAPACTDSGREARRTPRGRVGSRPAASIQAAEALAMIRSRSLRRDGAVLRHADPKTTARYPISTRKGSPRDPRLHLTFEGPSGTVLPSSKTAGLPRRNSRTRQTLKTTVGSTLCGVSSVGRAAASQAAGRGFETRTPLNYFK